MPTIKHNYDPRPYLIPFHERDQRFAVLVMHRRAGKTVGVINDLIAKAVRNELPNPRYGYVAPLYNQAKQIAWQYLKDYSSPFTPKLSESGLFVEFPHNGARITLYGADNPDAFRGLYFDGLVLDEFGNMRPSIWTEVLLPTLVDRHGWVVFMGTPNGPNHFRDMFEKYKDDKKWFVSLKSYTDTGVIKPEDIAQIRELMTEEEFAQEMECNFAASTRGAFYSKEIARAEEEGRVKPIQYDRLLPLHFVFDLGYTDDTCGWAWQETEQGFNIMLAFSNNRQPISYYINAIQAICDLRGVKRGEVWLPHDARAKTLQTGRSIVEQFVDAGIQPMPVPNLSVVDGISAARLLFPTLNFNKEETVDGVLALKSYHREFDEDRKIFKDNPVHDWSSHYADGFRYFALVAKKRSPIKRSRSAILQDIYNTNKIHTGLTYEFSLEDLYADRREPDENDWRM